MKTFGETIKAARIKRGWRQCDLAHGMDWSSGQLCDYENDRRLPPRDTRKISRLAWLLKLPEKPLLRLAADTRAKPKLPLDIKVILRRHPAQAIRLLRRAKVIGLGLALKKLGG